MDYREEATVEEGGNLHLENLPFKAGERVEVVIHKSADRRPGWPKGYFTDLFGASNDPSFVRQPQGEYDRREPFN